MIYIRIYIYIYKYVYIYIQIYGNIYIVFIQQAKHTDFADGAKNINLKNMIQRVKLVTTVPCTCNSIAMAII